MEVNIGLHKASAKGVHVNSEAQNYKSAVTSVMSRESYNLNSNTVNCSVFMWFFMFRRFCCYILHFKTASMICTSHTESSNMRFLSAFEEPTKAVIENVQWCIIAA